MYLDRTFHALSDGTRRGMLSMLSRKGELTASELGAPFDISQPTASKHLRVLMVGDRLSQRGGIATLQRMQLRHAPAYIHTTQLATHDEGSSIFRVAFFLRAWLRANRLVRRELFDVVHIHQSGGGSLVRKALIVGTESRLCSHPMNSLVCRSMIRSASRAARLRACRFSSITP